MIPNQLVVITKTDLSLFGCPHCSSRDGSKLISLMDFYIWACDSCEGESAVVKSKLAEIFTMDLKNTDLVDLVGKHPFRDSSIKIPIFESLNKQPFQARAN